MDRLTPADLISLSVYAQAWASEPHDAHTRRLLLKLVRWAQGLAHPGDVTYSTRVLCPVCAGFNEACDVCEGEQTVELSQLCELAMLNIEKERCREAQR